MNIQEVPPAPEGNNILQFAIRTRLKLFYRPQGIATSLPKAVENLQWQQSANTLSFTNNSPLHITVINAEAIDNKGKIYPLKNFMLLPYSHHAVNIASMQRLHKMKYINDYGAVVDIPIKK
ncbi:gram-negative pili assembly chaperone domain protein [Klebsiella pneumoniae subsp. pneumoniae DSM 30104 = JCM 1662 = NBRC 14940]|uniref:Pilin chaperone n=1 Tax=Klebsiella pneumoniae TaxID=573 RepID=A0A377TXT6_KLEPN|nr:gram-negative pili assembly chaperone domain protein [Klebsiella pneumoniae subsp. pneumoniae DSM 30104 = JCM 1662 = NBRC 14940]STS84533.1 pilin chaperone [Klebsiella pneumoniae]VEC02199.1 Pili assembly chaperone [Klebsiella pneumoniae]